TTTRAAVPSGSTRLFSIIMAGVNCLTSLTPSAFGTLARRLLSYRSNASARASGGIARKTRTSRRERHMAASLLLEEIRTYLREASWPIGHVVGHEVMSLLIL